MTNARQPPGHDLRDLMAMIGYLMLRWGEVERRLAGRKLPPELDHLRLHRNRVCHGLESARAYPGEEPSVRVSVDGETITYRWKDLDDAIRELEAFRG